MKNGKILRLFIIFLGAVGLLLYLFVWFEEGDVHPPLRIAINVWPGHAHAFIAKEKGFFSKNGVEVTLKLNQEQSQSVAQYNRGELDGLFDVFTNTVVGLAEGIPTRVVYVVDYSQSGDVIVGRSEFASLADVKGRMVSFEEINSFSHIYVLKALANHGLDESTVRFKMVPAQEVLTALEQGRIDAGHTWQPTTSKALAKGYKILSTAGDIPGIITDVLAFSAKVIEQRPKDIQAVVKSMLEALAFVTAHKAEAVAIMAKAEGMSREEMASGLSGVFHLDLPGNIAAMTRSQSPTSLYGSGEFIVRFLLSRGQLNHTLDLDQVIDARFVKALQ